MHSSVKNSNIACLTGFLAFIIIHSIFFSGVFMRDPNILSSTEPTSADRVSADAILKHCSIQNVPHVYVLGSYEGRVTIHSQQIRALNLIYALEIFGKFKLPSSGELRVAVIGGGIAGMMAAVAAARLQVSVTIFERQSELLHNLRGCHTRHLHPNIYDWPLESASNPETNLPFLNWHADTANQVAESLLKQWQIEVLKPGQSITVRSSVEICIRDSLMDEKRRLTIVSHPHDELSFDVIILAVGFGVEKNIAPQPLRSYWRDDSLHQPEIERRSGRTRYLVSGNGDGGLVDILRIRLSDFKQENLIKDFGLDKFLHSGALLDIEKRIMWVADPDRSMYEQYSRLAVPDDLDKLLTSRLRTDTAVTFNYATWAFSTRSSVLHRYLVCRLLKIDPNTTGQPGIVKSVEGHEPNLRVQLDIDGEMKIFDFNRVVIRHGPNSAVLRDFPALHEKLQATLRARNDLDATRQPVWTTGFFDEKKEVSREVVDEDPGSATASSQSAEHHNNEGVVKADVSSDISANDSTVMSFGTILPHSNNAVQLRDELRVGKTENIKAKFSLLNIDDKKWILSSIAAASLIDDSALDGFGQLLAVCDIDVDWLNKKLTQIITDSVFKSSTGRKESILHFGTQWLRRVDNEVISIFFDGIIKLINRDQFTEVNSIMPALAVVQEVIPPGLYEIYIDALLSQCGSRAIHGAPAARKALVNLPTDMVKVLFQTIDVSWLLNHSDFIKDELSLVFKKHFEIIPPDRIALFEEYMVLDYGDFIRAHTGSDE